ncbi:MAG: AAA domain-containing protein [Lachnoclostridium sp.]|nr:AAA domain-containing protein [Lachnospira sp.]MCM1248868.1 AAA domain-containing protein [Lachnoclostridium sp.]
MNNIHHDIFRAIHEGKWLKIEYKNKKEEVTKYWIGIRNLNAAKRTLAVEGLHLGRYTTDSYDTIYIDSIISSQIVEGSYCPVNQKLVQDIYLNPHKYKMLFDNIANLKILNYLEMCNRMDTTPYYSDFELVKFLDGDSFQGESYQLSTEQFQTIVKNFQYKMDEKERKSGKLVIQQLALNVLSINTNRGLYVLAYRKLQLDVKNKVLRPDDEITVCTEFYLGETKENIRKYLDAEEYELLRDFEKNQEQIKDCVTRHTNQVMGVDDMPYIIGLGMEVVLDLHSEYRAIIDMYSEGKATIPIKAFFGELLKPPIRRKEYPITLIDKRINLDQLLAINNAMKYPIAYIQGPPGTGKTNTIINTIVTAFFNERTVLFASYNNHPINSVFEKLRSMEYKGKKIPFPVLRLGNQDKVKEAIEYIKKVYAQVKDVTVYESTLDKNKDDRSERAKKLSNLLKKYEDVLDFKERRETLNRMLEYQRRMTASLEMVPFQSDLQGRQLNQVQEKIGELGETTDEEALALLDNNLEELYKYLFYTSARYIKRLGEEKYKELRDILFEEKEEKQVADFQGYLSNTSNVKKLQKIFPVIITTCISAHKLGEPKPIFDMVIIDEASQCNTAVSLVPIIRGENLMLVGDPQQLNPVILLDELTNQKLRKKYNVADEYDYRTNSIYKTFLACDAVSDEVLLHNHYRCNRKIIEFNNKKYYNSKLKICSDSKEQNPLVLINVKSNRSDAKNTADGEVEEIVRYAYQNKDKTIGVITPFVNQRKLIEQAVQCEKLQNVACGTVHAFQGDEKDVVLFSMALTDQTQAGTYEWLKNNKELINVATSRAKDKLILLLDEDNLVRLHQKNSEDDLFELVQYVKEKGESLVTPKHTNSRALGVKPFSTATEEAFLENLNHALENIWLSQSRYSVQKEVAISQVFEDNINYSDLFYSGRFDFVVYERQGRDNIPILAIELDGKEHFEDEVVQNRDRKKNEICHAHNLQIIRVENSYARRYNHIKEILLNYFSIRH